MLEAVSPEDMRTIAGKLVEMAKAGNVPAIREVLVSIASHYRASMGGPAARGTVGSANPSERRRIPFRASLEPPRAGRRPPPL
jgi:hypothetical protein